MEILIGVILIIIVITIGLIQQIGKTHSVRLKSYSETWEEFDY